MAEQDKLLCSKKRPEKDVDTMQAFKVKYNTLDVALKNMSVAPERKLFPIPFREISLNATLTQHPGY